jgi:hypothetical protein
VLARKHSGEPVLVYFHFGVADKDSAETTAFKRDVVKVLAGHEILSRVIANQADLKETVRDSGLPVNEEYVDPYVPVSETSGALVTGEVVKDSEGDIVGGKAETLKTETLKPEAERNPNAEDRDPKGESPIADSQVPIDDSQPGKMMNREGAGDEAAALERSGKLLVIEALRSEFESMNARLAAIAEIEDPETQKRKLAGVLADLDGFARDLSKDPAVATAIYKVLAAGLANGMAEGKSEI